MEHHPETKSDISINRMLSEREQDFVFHNEFRV